MPLAALPVLGRDITAAVIAISSGEASFKVPGLEVRPLPCGIGIQCAERVDVVLPSAEWLLVASELLALAVRGQASVCGAQMRLEDMLIR